MLWRIPQESNIASRAILEGLMKRMSPMVPRTYTDSRKRVSLSLRQRLITGRSAAWANWWQQPNQIGRRNWLEEINFLIRISWFSVSGLTSGTNWFPYTCRLHIFSLQLTHLRILFPLDTGTCYIYTHTQYLHTHTERDGCPSLSGQQNVKLLR